MSEIVYKLLPGLVDDIKAGKGLPVYLLYGDEFLYKSAFKAILDAVVPSQHQDLNYEAVDGDKEDLLETIQYLNTFPLIPSAKVIAIHGTRVFYSSEAAENLLNKSKAAFEREDLKEAARHLLNVLAVSSMSLDDAKDGNWKSLSDSKLRAAFETVSEHKAEAPWIDQVVAYCTGKGLSVPLGEDDAEVLNDAILKGYPETNHLILTTDLVDKRRRLYKTIKKMGVVVDCSMAKGEKAADKRKQQDSLREHMKRILSEAGKTMAPGGLEALVEKVGPDVRRFNSELEKLVNFVGERTEILPSDVGTLSKRTKQDPIYEMTNALAERETRKALFFLDSLLKNNFHPIPVVTALANQIRKLILAKDFIRGSHGKAWRKDLSYGGFQKTVLPQLKEHESDLLAGAAHPYPVYNTLKHSDNYTLEELIKALEVLLDTDIRLKSSAQDPKTVLEYALLRICGGGAMRL